ncbi:hypothetical protein D3C87_1692490 [compost metagenome]
MSSLLRNGVVGPFLELAATFSTCAITISFSQFQKQVQAIAWLTWLELSKTSSLFSMILSDKNQKVLFLAKR